MYGLCSPGLVCTSESVHIFSAYEEKSLEDFYSSPDEVCLCEPQNTDRMKEEGPNGSFLSALITHYPCSFQSGLHKLLHTFIYFFLQMFVSCLVNGQF